ncbi:MAG: hypothetical protein DIU71_12755 [Proteobacteria bacterium]|nr:MAG: hypothetical protein DIU71_12755 [Pseudomonadota bacterium]
MTDSKDKQPAQGLPGPQKRSGRVAYDARGNPVWEWQLATGVYTQDGDALDLDKLDLGGLSIVETDAEHEPAEQPPREPQRLPGGGFNPYDNAPVTVRDPRKAT